MVALLALLLGLPPAAARPLRPVATYSIVARDPSTGELGVAVQSHWFSVGSNVSWAEAGVGAVATQSFIDPAYGPLGLQLMRAGRSAPDALKALLAGDAQRDVRQVGMVDAQGRAATHTGAPSNRAVIKSLFGARFLLRGLLTSLPSADRQRRAAVVTRRQREHVTRHLPVPRPTRGQRTSTGLIRRTLAFDEVGEGVILQIDRGPAVGGDDAITHLDPGRTQQIRRGLVGFDLHVKVPEVVVVQYSGTLQQNRRLAGRTHLE